MADDDVQMAECQMCGQDFEDTGSYLCEDCEADEYDDGYDDYEQDDLDYD